MQMYSPIYIFTFVHTLTPRQTLSQNKKQKKRKLKIRFLHSPRVQLLCYFGYFLSNFPSVGPFRNNTQNIHNKLIVIFNEIVNCASVEFQRCLLSQKLCREQARFCGVVDASACRLLSL